MGGGAWGREKKKFPRKEFVKRLEENFKNQLMLTKLVNIGIGGDGKKNPINAPSIQNGALVVLVHSGLFFQVFFIYITPFMTKLRVMVRVVCVNVEYETCKCKYNYLYMILCIYLKQYKK